MKKITLLPVLVCLVTSCEIGDIIKPKDDEPKDPVIPQGYVESVYKIQNEDALYKALYNYKNKIEISLKFSNESLSKLQEYGNVNDERVEMYHPCDMTLKINDDTYTFEEVGARMRGNTSRTNDFVKNDNTLNHEKFCNFKLSFSQTFDSEKDNDYYIRTWETKDLKKERKNRRLGGQKKVDFKWNKEKDNTFTKQSYAFYAFEQEGVPCQKDNVIKLNVSNDTDSVSYLVDMMEAVDSTFLGAHFKTEDAAGNLYKCLYQKDGPADYSRSSLKSIGLETPTWTPIYELKTNDEDTEHVNLKNLVNKLNEDKSEPATFKPVLDGLVDVDEFLKYSALSWIVGNPDDMRNNYNNFFTYFRSTDNKLVVMPYDMDRCFGILEEWEVHTENYGYASYKQVTNNQNLRNPLFYRTIISGNSDYGKNFKVVSEYQKMYQHYCYTFAHKYLDNAKFQEFTNQFPWVEKDVSKGGGKNLSFSSYATKKLAVAPTADPLI